MQELVSGLDSYLFGGAAGFAIGATAGYALKKIIKLAAIILGAFLLGVAYLSYRGWIDVHWQTLQNQAMTGMINATQMASHYIESTAAQVSQHPILQGEGVAITATIGFIPGLLWGIRK